MREPRMLYYELHRTNGLCDCCDVLLLKTIIIGFTVISTISGAVVLGMGLVMQGSQTFLPEDLGHYAPELKRISMGMMIIGAVMVIMCIIGCVATAKENIWFTIVYILALVLVMAAQLSCGLLTLFLREEIRSWVTQREADEECEGCVEAYRKVMIMPTVAAILMLATLLLQLAVIIAAFRVSRMRTAENKDQLLEQMISKSSHNTNDVMMLDYNRNTRDLHDYADPSRVHCPSHEITSAAGDDVTASKIVTRRVSTSPAKLPGHVDKPRVSAYVHCSEYETIQECETETK